MDINGLCILLKNYVLLQNNQLEKKNSFCLNGL